MACNAGEVIFDVNKKNDLTHEEIWDDTILIQQYDEALARVQKKLNNRLGTTESDQSEATTQSESVNNKISKKKKKKRNKKQDWHTGDFCQAKYSVDGHLYEAAITALHPERSKATVQYVGYDNEEDVSLRNLSKSRGPEARRRQEDLADDRQSEFSDVGSSIVESEMLSDTDGERSNKRQRHPCSASSHPHMMPPPPSFSMSGTQFNPPPHLPDLPPPPALTMDMSDNPRTAEALHTMLMSWYMTGYHTGYYQGLRQVDLQKQRRKCK